MPIKVVPVVLEGKTIRLEPLALSHGPGLMDQATAETFRFFGGAIVQKATPEGIQSYIETRLALHDVLSFAITLRENGEAVGHTSFMNIRPKDRVLEIGSTWIGENYRGTRVNPESKFLMLRQAFEVWGCVRVELKTDERNLQSRRAIAKLGAVQEGILRKHMVAADGHIRNTVMFSILDEEWPAVKTQLEDRLKLRDPWGRIVAAPS
jgi:RimJ/RimL family protein N-acetyltransferase